MFAKHVCLFRLEPGTLKRNYSTKDLQFSEFNIIANPTQIYMPDKILRL